jgi:hypothetical protein
MPTVKIALSTRQERGEYKSKTNRIFPNHWEGKNIRHIRSERLMERYRMELLVMASQTDLAAGIASRKAQKSGICAMRIMAGRAFYIWFA